MFRYEYTKGVKNLQRIRFRRFGMVLLRLLGGRYEGKVLQEIVGGRRSGSDDFNEFAAGIEHVPGDVCNAIVGEETTRQWAQVIQQELNWFLHRNELADAGPTRRLNRRGNEVADYYLSRLREAYPHNAAIQQLTAKPLRPWGTEELRETLRRVGPETVILIHEQNGVFDPANPPDPPVSGRHQARVLR